MSEEQLIRFCPKCGAQLSGDAAFCTKCGASVTRDTSSQQESSVKPDKSNRSGRKEKKKGSKKTGIIIAVIVVVIILAAAMSGGDGDSDTDTVSTGVDLGVLGEDCSLDSLNEENEGATIMFTATFWSTRDDNYGYSVIYYPEDEEYGTTFYVKDSTDDKVLSALDDASYEDEIELTITGTYDKTTTFTGSESGSTQTIYYVTAKEAQILGTADTDDATAEDTEDKDTEDTGAFLEGVSDDYTEYSCMMDTDTVIEYFHELGYDYVWLESHEIGIPDNGAIGDIGTTDTIYALVTTVGGDDVYHVTEEIGILYVYWGDESGWLTSLSTGELVESDFTGFNDTYWKYTGYNDSEEDAEDRIKLAYQILGDEIDYDTLQESTSIELYLKLENFDDAYGYIESVTDFSRVYIHHETFGMIFGTAMLVIDGNIYAKNLQIGSNESVVKIGDYIVLCFSGDDFSEKVGVEFNFNAEDVEGTVIQISEKEYLSASEGGIIVEPNDSDDAETTTTETETTTEETTIAESETVRGMTDEEIMADLEWAGYEFDSIDQMRSRLYESEMATYTEEEVAAMTNEEAYYAFIEMMDEYYEEN